MAWAVGDFGGGGCGGEGGRWNRLDRRRQLGGARLQDHREEYGEGQ